MNNNNTDINADEDSEEFVLGLPTPRGMESFEAHCNRRGGLVPRRILPRRPIANSGGRGTSNNAMAVEMLADGSAWNQFRTTSVFRVIDVNDDDEQHEREEEATESNSEEEVESERDEDEEGMLWSLTSAVSTTPRRRRLRPRQRPSEQDEDRYYSMENQARNKEPMDFASLPSQVFLPSV